MQSRGPEARGNDGDPFKGLYISYEDSDLRLEERNPQGQSLFLSSSKAVDIKAAKASADQRAEDRLLNRNEPRLRKLAGTFSLSDVEIDAVLIYLAVELDRKYEKLHAYLQDDLTLKLPQKTGSIELFLGS